MRSVKPLAALAAALLLALVFAMAQQPRALGQSSWYGAQKRKVLALAIASTDCIARHTLDHPGILDAHRAQDLRPVIESVKPRCADEMDHLSREYADLHGWGSGYRFVAGSYNDDLPRAVLKRIGGELDRRLEERRVDEENDQRSSELLRSRMYECTRGQLAELLRSGETATVLASAALTICRQQVNEAVEAQVRLLRKRYPHVSGDTDDRDLRDRFQRTIREWVVTDAVRMRAEQHTSSPREPNQVKPKRPAHDDLSKPVLICLETVSGAQKNEFAQTKKLMQMMTELCRPEIEGLARGMFLADTSIPLDRARENALAFALEAASRLVGRPV